MDMPLRPTLRPHPSSVLLRATQRQAPLSMGGGSAVKTGFKPRQRKGLAVATRQPQISAANTRLSEAEPGCGREGSSACHAMGSEPISEQRTPPPQPTVTTPNRLILGATTHLRWMPPGSCQRASVSSSYCKTLLLALRWL